MTKFNHRRARLFIQDVQFLHVCVVCLEDIVNQLSKVLINIIGRDSVDLRIATEAIFIYSAQMRCIHRQLWVKMACIAVPASMVRSNYAR
jgi:hypothetical protein